MAEIIAVCTSKKKGTKKKNVGKAILKNDYGVIGDAHADCTTHRQVSLLAIESIEHMRDHKFDINPGDFAENLTTKGIELVSLPIGTRLSVGNEISLEVTQIGKECHSACEIRRQVGWCIMPQEGVFARVIRGGTVKVGDQVRIVEKKDGE